MKTGDQLLLNDWEPGAFAGAMAAALLLEILILH